VFKVDAEKPLADEISGDKKKPSTNIRTGGKRLQGHLRNLSRAQRTFMAE
jgi:hypothetical protein